MVTKNITGLLAVTTVLLGATFAWAEAELPPIKKLDGGTPNANVFADSGRNKPIVLRTDDEAAKYFKGAGLAKLKEQADFERQVVLVFAWRGSGQDRMQHVVQESFPEQVVFTLKPGRTRDLRPHVYVYALRSNVKWRIAGKSDGNPPKEEAEYVNIEIKGRLNSQVVAIWGETTGVVITTGGINWELDLGQDAQARKQAEKLHGKTVVATGRLQVKRGVEIAQRWIVTVESLQAAAGDAPIRKQSPELR